MKRGTAAETDFDRLCLAEVLILQDRLDAASKFSKNALKINRAITNECVLVWPVSILICF